MKLKLLLTLCFSFVLLVSFARESSKKLVAKRIIAGTPAPDIDADLNDFAWNNADIATDFIQMQPLNGASATLPTSVKIIYDDRAIYVGAYMHDPNPEDIYTELSPRDQIRQVDFFGIYFDPFYDAQTGYGFFVTASGVQVDRKANTNGGEDSSWDAVWLSEVAITDSGWIVEMEIPWSALRFPKNAGKPWGLNITRNIQRLREQSSWNYVDEEVSGFLTQQGRLTGIRNIKPPLRLSFFPYVSGYLENQAGDAGWDYYMNYGMDLKYGINESFTLDMTLIPDFGQVQSDDRIVNLSPFETYYSERRPFFTEGTELFNKNGVFYSRRIGSEPINRDEVASEYDRDKIINNPGETQLINATKVSGKTSGSLGIGVFNAMTSATYAKIGDSAGEQKDILTQPFTNYNMVVFDQTLKNNSYISFYNTNVYRGKSEYTANVSGVDGRIRDKDNIYQARAYLNVSQKYFPDDQPDLGYNYYLTVGKISGKFRAKYWQNVESDNYDPNDMGFLRNNNEFAHGLDFSYNIYQPRGIILESYSGIDFRYSSLYAPRKFQSFRFEVDNRTTFTNYLTAGFEVGMNPVESYNYFEPRVDGWQFNQPENYWASLFFSPDYRRRFVLDGRAGIWSSHQYDQFDYWYSISPRFRVNDKLTLRHRFNFNMQENSIGYVADSLRNDQHVIIFGNRNILNITNTFNTSYIFSNKSSLSFRLRHYWIKAVYDQFFDLQKSGYLQTTDYDENHDFNYNAFNIDMVFTWNFAPGSEMLVVWKNAIYQNDAEAIDDFFNNLERTLDSPANNSFSIKVMYYLDYHYLKKKVKEI